MHVDRKLIGVIGPLHWKPPSARYSPTTHNDAVEQFLCRLSRPVKGVSDGDTSSRTHEGATIGELYV